MQTLGLIEETNIKKEQPTEVEKPFWRRQFQKESTSTQRKFDWIFGVIFPVICFAFDPLVFKGGFCISEGAYLGTYKPFAYLLSFVSIMAMLAFLMWGKKLGWLNGFLAGFFVVGSVISFIVAVLILPYSLIGLFVLIGVLGFTPFFSAFVFLRNSFRAYHFARIRVSKTILIRSFILASLFGLITPAVINVEIHKLINEMKTGDVQTIQKNSAYLKFVAPITNFDPLVEGYDVLEPTKKKVLAEEFEALTGNSIENRLRSIYH